MLLCVAVCAPVMAHGAETTWLERAFSFNRAEARPIIGANTFMLKGVQLEASCLIKQEQFQPLFTPLINKQVSDVAILQLMRDMRSALAKQGFRDIQTSYPASKVRDGIVTITIQAKVPPAMADVAHAKCPNQPVFIAGRSALSKAVKDVTISGILAIDPTPFIGKANTMQGKNFNALEVIELMQAIRQAYRDAKQPLPYISFDNALAKEGTVKLTVVEKKRKAPPPSDISPENIPIKVVRPAPTPPLNLAEKQKPVAKATAKPAPKVVAKPFSKEDVADGRIGIAPPKAPSETIQPTTVVQAEPAPEPTHEPTPEPAPIPPNNTDVVLIDDQETTFLDAATPQDLEYKERSESELLILETFIGRELREEALLAYTTKETKQLLLSLSGFVKALGVPITVTPEQGMANGWYLAEDNMFQLLYPFERAFMGNKRYQLNRGAAELHFDDIYVSATALETLFDVKIELNFSALQLFITPSEKLPFQEQNERYQAWGKLQSAKARLAAQPEPPRQDVPYMLASKPTVRLDSRTNYRKNDGDGSLTQNLSAITQGDLLGFSNQTTLSMLRREETGQYELDSFETLFRRQDDTSSLLGPLQASTVQWGDITMTPIPLIEGTRKGRGIEVSNEPVGFVRDPDNLTIEGFAPPTWDVEIFQDERLIDFLTVDSSGRYEFTAVPLRSGLNVFRILAHGPNGELRETQRRFFLGAGQVKDGEFVYQISALEGTKPLIGIGNNADRLDLGSALQSSFTYGLSQGLSVTGGLYDGAINTLDTSAAAIGLRASIAEAYIQADAMAEENGGNIYSFTARRNMSNTLQLFLGGETSDGFDSITRQEKANYFARLDNSIQLGTLHPIGFSLEYRKETFNNGQSPVTRWQNRLNTFVERFNISNELELEQRRNTADLLRGNFLVRRPAWGGFWRGQLTYRQDQEGFVFDNTNLRGQFALGSNMNYTGEINQTLTGDKLTRFNNRLTWEWRALRLGVESQIDDTGDYSLGLSVGTTFMPKQNGYTPISSQSASSEGTVLVRVFIDGNEDKLYQDGEEVLKGVTIKNRSRGSEAATTENGIASLSKMATFTPNHVFVDATTLPDFYLQPADALVSVIARPGIIGTVDMPIYRLGELGGTVTLNINGQTSVLDGAPINLIDADGNKIGSLKSEFDGYFVFPSLRMGTYKLVIPQHYLAQYGLDAALETVVNLTAEMSIVDDITLAVDGKKNG